jgi:hypothetical protein
MPLLSRAAVVSDTGKGSTKIEPRGWSERCCSHVIFEISRVTWARAAGTIPRANINPSATGANLIIGTPKPSRVGAKQTGGLKTRESITSLMPAAASSLKGSGSCVGSQQQKPPLYRR